MKTAIVTDSGSGLSKKEANDLGLEFLPLQIQTSNAQYLDGVEVDADAIINLLEQGEFPKTSQPSLASTEEMLEKLEKEGVTDLITVNVSSALSSTNAQVQASAIRHNIKVHNVEPHSTLFVQQYLALEALKLLEAGLDPESVAALLQEKAEKCTTFVAVEDLKHLAAGGRLGPAAAAIGSMLKIKPILKLDESTQGKVELDEKVRTFSRAIKKMAEKAASHIKGDGEYLIYLGDGKSDAMEQLEQELLEALGPKAEQVEIRHDVISPVLLCHTGTGCAGVQIIEK